MVQNPVHSEIPERAAVGGNLPSLRILHIITRYNDSGAERNTDSTIAAELALGHEVHLAAGREANFDNVGTDVTTWQIPNLVRNLSPLADLRAIRDLRRLIKRNRYDVVHTHTSKAGIIGRAAARERVGAIIHTVHGASFGPGYGRVASFAFLCAERFSARYTDFLLSVGDELRDIYLRAGIGSEERFRVVRSLIEVDRFLATRSLPAAERASIRASFVGDIVSPVALLVGLLEPRKRPQLVVESLAPLLRSGRLTLLIVGQGPLQSRLQGRVRELGIDESVHFLGQVSDMPALFASADLLVHAATAEGVPRVVTEALAAGLPIVATDVVGIREIPGADVTIVNADGGGLGGAVLARLEAEFRPPSDASAFESWTADAIAQQTASYQAEIIALLRDRGRKSRIDPAGMPAG